MMTVVASSVWADTPTIGGGDIDHPAIGPAPAYQALISDKSFVLVKNWDFGAARGNTITDQQVMNEHFQYHDQFGFASNGNGLYGTYIVAPDAATAITNGYQPIEGINTSRPVRQFTEQSLKTYVVPLNGATTVNPVTQKAGSGSFQAKWTLDNGGSRLGHDLLWETRVRMTCVPYFWFAIWTCGNVWDQGAEIDAVESFGYDNGNGNTNYDGRYWHSNSVGGKDETNYSNWETGMATHGVKQFDPTAWHTWSLLYKTDDSYAIFLDGRPIQRGVIDWTRSGAENGVPLNMSFIFDGSWGHTVVNSVNHDLPAEALGNLVYEWDYSRIYLSTVSEPATSSLRCAEPILLCRRSLR